MRPGHGDCPGRVRGADRASAVPSSSSRRRRPITTPTASPSRVRRRSPSVFETPLALPGLARHGAARPPGRPGRRTSHRPASASWTRIPWLYARSQIAEGSDLAFRGRLMIAGGYDGIGLFKRSSRSLEQISFHRCPAAQGDVTVPATTSSSRSTRPARTAANRKTCNNTPTDVSDSSLEKEGLRIVDISNPRKPTQAGFIETECGSHTQTLVPGRQAELHLRPVLPADRCGHLHQAHPPRGRDLDRLVPDR